MKTETIDIHTHTMGIEDTAEYQFGKFSKWIGKKKSRLKLVQNCLYWLGEKTHIDELERYAVLLDYLDDSTESKIVRMLQRVDCIVINTMDLAYCGAGDVKRDYRRQLDELISLKTKYNIKIFMHLEPKRDNFWELVDYYQFFVDGWKLYPPVSGYPTDHDIQAVLKKYPKPVTAHCTDTSPIYYKGEDIDLMIDWSHWTARGGSQKDKCQSFSHPYWLAVLAKSNPQVSINAAHGGGKNPKLRDYVKKYCREIPNFYTDCSFTFGDPKENFEEFHKGIETKGLYGTDNTMCGAFTVAHMEQLQKNNKNFLNLK